MGVNIYSSMDEALAKLKKYPEIGEGVGVDDVINYFRYVDPVPLPHGVPIPRLLSLMQKSDMVEVHDRRIKLPTRQYRR